MEDAYNSNVETFREKEYPMLKGKGVSLLYMGTLLIPVWQMLSTSIMLALLYVLSHSWINLVVT